MRSRGHLNLHSISYCPATMRSRGHLNCHSISYCPATMRSRGHLNLHSISYCPATMRSRSLKLPLHILLPSYYASRGHLNCQPYPTAQLLCEVEVT
ncbi:hypothetical protein CDAR_439931 [Caerostris darwini]|uniref:Uncharacterized protein n=1 Tax=Caerostris darwini TaxID=1538125 RepID=A0AAV4SL97_9ARAC|nr:hypothetical protein CDAR_439931 [Caerostris darwini]